MKTPQKRSVHIVPTLLKTIYAIMRRGVWEKRKNGGENCGRRIAIFVGRMVGIGWKNDGI
jgi:hypothetical protein